MSTRTALILGATSEIAQEITKLMCKDGYQIILAGRNLDALMMIKEDLTQTYTASIFTVKFDANKLEAINQFIKDKEDLPDVVLCALGELNLELSDNVISEKIINNCKINFLFPSLILEKFAVEAKARQRAITLVGISSIAGDRGRAKNYWYGAMKAGFTTALSGIRQKYNSSEIKVITVLPGFVETNMTKHMELPKLLTLSAPRAASIIYSGIKQNKDIIVPSMRWQSIRFLLTHIPERIFRTLNF